MDRVISVDLQRPGQGHEACFFDVQVPLEVISSTELHVQHFVKSVNLIEPIVVVTPNAECFRKARKMQLGLQKFFSSEVQLAAFFSSDFGSGPTDTSKLELVGNAMVNGADVVIVDDMVDTAGTLSDLSKRLHLAGARNVYVSASHGLFTEKSMELIQNGPVTKVVVLNTLPLKTGFSNKVTQLDISPLISDVILADYYSRDMLDSTEEFEIDD